MGGVVNLHLHINLPADVEAKFVGLLNQILEQGRKIMATVQETQAAVANEDTKVDTLLAAYKDLAAQVAANASDPVALQAIVDDANAKSAAIDAVLNPPAPPAANVPPVGTV